MGRGGATVAREARNHADNAAVPHGRRGLQGGGGPRAVGSSLAFPRHVCVPRRDPHECFLPLSPGRPERPVCLSFPHPLPLNAILRRSIRPCLCSLPRFAPRVRARVPISRRRRGATGAPAHQAHVEVLSQTFLLLLLMLLLLLSLSDPERSRGERTRTAPANSLRDPRAHPVGALAHATRAPVQAAVRPDLLEQQHVRALKLHKGPGQPLRALDAFAL